MKIAFFGLPLAALLLAEDGHDVALAALCRKGALGERRLRRRLGEDRVSIKPRPDSAAFQKRLRQAAPDLVVSWFWTTKLPGSVLSAAPLGAIGVHPSLLPRHRGPDPYFWALDAGDPVTGVTAHELAEEYDTGAVLGHRELAIEPSWNAWTLAKKLDRPSLGLLRDTVRAFARGERPAPVAQDERLSTLAPAPTEDDLEIDWSWTADRVARRVRAASPLPGAFTYLGDDAVGLLRVAATDEFPRALRPGEAAVVVHEGLETALVRAADRAVLLLEGVDDDERPLGRADLALRVRASTRT